MKLINMALQIGKALAVLASCALRLSPLLWELRQGVMLGREKALRNGSSLRLCELCLQFDL